MSKVAGSGSTDARATLFSTMLREARFRVVKFIGRILTPFMRTLDPRVQPLPGQVRLLPARTVEIDLSKLLFVGPKPAWMEQPRFDLQAAFQVELRDAEMIGKGVVITRTGEVILESTLFRRSYFRRSHVEHLILGRRWLAADHFDQVLPLTNYLDLNYFHWTLEALGRLAFAEDQLIKDGWKVLIDERSSAYVRSTLAFFFGLDGSQVVTGHRKRKIMHRCLLVSNPHSAFPVSGGVEVHAPEHLRWLNRRGHERIGGVRPERHNIVITRKQQIGRHITNEALLAERFPSLRLRYVALEDLTIAEQVDLFAHAGVIIGVHGAGFTNLVYAKDAAVIEFYPTALPEKNTIYFTQITAHLGLPHLVLSFTGEGIAPHWNHTLSEDDLQRMQRFLEENGRLQ